MLITVSGLDGAGKSTLIEGLRRELDGQRRPSTVLHLNDHVGIYAWARAARDRLIGQTRSPIEAPPRMTPRPTRLGRLRDAILWNKPLRRLVYPLDLLFFLGVRFYVEKIRGRILIVDRYFYDRLVDVAPPGEASAGMGWAWLRFLARVTPAPNLAVLLEVSPEEAFARKGEYTVAYLQRRDAAYRRVFAWVPAAAAVRLPVGTPHAPTHALARVVRHLESPETSVASATLRLLLEHPQADPAELDWTALPAVARRGGVLVRLAGVLTRRGDALPPRLAAAAADASARTQRVLELVDRLGAACNRLGIAHAFLKTVEPYPDAGHDVDLLIAHPSPRADRLILRDAPAIPRSRGFRNRLAGSTTYVAAYGIVIDIRHGRLGQLGEQARYARLLLERARPTAAGAITCRSPSREDNLLLLAAHQMYARPAFRLADVYWAITAVRDQQLDWDYVFATALSMGMVPSIGAYLEYVDRMHARLFSRPLVAADVLARFQVSSGRARERDGARFPVGRAAARLYVQQVRATLESGRWHSAARLSLLPFVALAAGSRRRA